MRLFANAGVVLNHERYQPDANRAQPVDNQVEGMAGLTFSFFRFRMLEVNSSFRLFPSISDAGRVRGDFNADLRLRLVSGKKLWWNLSTGLFFDSRPPTGSSGTDYATTTSVSYSFP
jgi:hypothetical protein